MKILALINLIPLLAHFTLAFPKDSFVGIRPRFQIPNKVPIRRPKKSEKCYLGDESGIGFTEVVFIAIFKFPLNKITWEVVERLDVADCQIAPNAWHTFVGAQVLWGIIIEGRDSLSLNKFLYCYKP